MIATTTAKSNRIIERKRKRMKEKGEEKNM